MLETKAQSHKKRTNPSKSDGASESLTSLLETQRSEYFALTYWSDGLRIHGFLGRPKGDIPRPAIIYNRGGSRKTGILAGPELIPYVEAGYVVAASQYRGNAGSEGQEEFGGADVNDVLNLITLLENQPYVDRERLAMVGVSRGGMMTYLALKWLFLRGDQEIIKAAAAVGGIADVGRWLEDRPDMVPLCFDLVGFKPEEAPELYKARSAVYWPEFLTPPLLLQHGEDDEKVGLYQSLTLADLLTRSGKIVSVVTHPGGDHALSSHEGGVAEILAWLQHHIGHPAEDGQPYIKYKERIFEVRSLWVNKYPGQKRKQT